MTEAEAELAGGVKLAAGTSLEDDSLQVLLLAIACVSVRCGEIIDDKFEILRRHHGGATVCVAEMETLCD